ncbi:MAG: transposase [Deltaproteobacteria bacterium]|jgi:transposase|nr:transposase [Deltaproteobacteria bacterium]
MIDVNEFFRSACDIPDDISINDIVYNLETREVHLYLKFLKGMMFVCPICGEGTQKVYDKMTKVWRHINLAKFKCFFHCDVPRIECQTCGVHRINVPWARPKSSLTYDFEIKLVTSAKSQPVSTVALEYGLHDTRVWRVVNYYAEKLPKEEDWSKVRKIGIVATASLKAYEHITVFLDISKERVIFATEGKGPDTIKKFANEMKKHGALPSQITHITLDKSQSYLNCCQNYFPRAKLTFHKG